MLEGSVRHRYQSATEVLKALELEPYLDSLAKSMNAQRNAASSSSSGSAYTPSIAQTASAIRARRAKSLEGLDEQTVIINSQALTPTQRKHKAPRKLDTISLLTAYANGRRNFTLHDLSLLDLQRANLQSANFSSSKLVRTNLQKANLFKSNFSKASLKQANLKEASLSQADLNHADLEEADLRGADLTYADLNDANLRGANLCGANLTGAKLTEEQLALAKINRMTVRPSGKQGLL